MSKLPTKGIALGFIMAVAAFNTQAATSDYRVTEFPNGVVCYKAVSVAPSCVYVPNTTPQPTLEEEKKVRKGFKEAIQDGQQYASQLDELLETMQTK
ncbi:hypothetical protein [Pseudomonas phage vB_PseuGesM_254]|uniref:Uncharacterized protein n=1 Tax=Pseudomonas phage vB_PseuGesM_254 TaxID=3092638 RepID=A0AAX4G6X0_9CAUD|nr:hypothetical protein [Pseudomonas phage PseuGes_254]